MILELYTCTCNFIITVIINYDMYTMLHHCVVFNSCTSKKEFLDDEFRKYPYRSRYRRIWL